MSITQQYADTPAGLDTMVTSYLNEGYSLATKSEAKATLQKNKKPLSAALIIICLFLPIFGWAFIIGYLIVHGSKPASQVVEITVGTQGSAPHA